MRFGIAGTSATTAGLLLVLRIAAAAQGVCDRTPEVRDKLIEAADVSACEDVTRAHLSEVTLLDFKNVGISELKAQDFSGLSNLEKLDLSRNNLSSLPERIFDGLDSLQTLNLWTNNLTSLREEDFEDLDSLQTLNLGLNKFSSIPEGVFDGLSNLVRLELLHNDLTRLPQEIFSGLSNLEWLDLSENNLSGLPEDIFDGLSNLVRLDLSHNDLTSIPAGIFQDLVSLQTLPLASAFRALIGSALDSLPEQLFDGLGNLEYLDLSRNGLASFPPGMFRGLDKLEYLNLSNARLTGLPAGIFDGLSNLKSLSIRSFEALEVLPDGIFDGLDSLHYLSLARVPLDILPVGIFDDVLDTLGGVYTILGRGYRGGLDLNLDVFRMSALAFGSTSQTAREGESIRIVARLSSALPVAIRVPYTIGGTATSDAYAAPSPSPSDGLLFPAGETRKEIWLTLKESTGNRGKTIVLTLAEPYEIKLRPSGGTGPDAPHLEAAGIVARLYEAEGIHTLTIYGTSMGEPEPARAIFVPVLLTSAGRNNSYFTSELALTNRGTERAILDYTYTAHRGGGSGSGSDNLAPGQQRIQPDAIGYLAGLGIPIPASGNRIGTLTVEVSGSSEVSLTTRTATDVPEGRAGLAYPGIAKEEGFQEAVYLCGLRQNIQDRSNVALQNMGLEDEITLRTTVFSGEVGDTSSHLVGEEKLPPGGFHQYNEVLKDLGSPTQGYVKVEKIDGDAPFYAYGVINDNFNSDGSFIFPVAESSLVGTSGQSLPVIIETGSFRSELTVTNFSASDKQVDFSFVADAVDTGNDTAIFSLKLKAGEQRILPDLVSWMRQEGVAGIGPAGQVFVGALFATPSEGDLNGIVIGARTGSPDRRGGQYSLFYNAVPYGSASVESAWIYGLQQNAENRSNLALVNTGEIDNSPITLEITIFDGSGELEPNMKSVTLKPRRWTQENGILGTISQGYVQVRKVSGNNPFIAYGVINDGGRPGERTGDGAFVLSRE